MRKPMNARMRESKGLTPEQEERCINEAAYYVDVNEVPTVNEVLELFDSDEFYADFFGSKQRQAAKRIVELCNIEYYEFFERYHNVLEDSTILANYYDLVEEDSMRESTKRTGKRRVRESSAPSDVIDALHELKSVIKQYKKTRQSILDYVINDLTEAFL